MPTSWNCTRRWTGCWDRQAVIEQRLARRHLGSGRGGAAGDGGSGGSVLYDLSSSFYYGTHCPLARFGHDRDKKGLAIIVYGVLATAAGLSGGHAGVRRATRPTRARWPTRRRSCGSASAWSVRCWWGTAAASPRRRSSTLREYPGLGWIGALRSTAIRKLLDAEADPALAVRPAEPGGDHARPIIPGSG